MSGSARYGRLTAVVLDKRSGEAPARPQASPRSRSNLAFSKRFRHVAPMDQALANEFPFVTELPKREAKKALTFWEQVEHLSQAQERVGPIVPQSLVAKVFRVSGARIGQMIGDGMLEGLDVDGRKFVTKRSLVAYAEQEHKRGRPVKGSNIREALQAAWENANGK